MPVFRTQRAPCQQQAWLFTGVPAYSAEEKEKFYSAVILKEEDVNLHYRHVPTYSICPQCPNEDIAVGQPEAANSYIDAT